MRSGDYGFEGDTVAEPLELDDCPAASVGGIIPGNEVVPAKVSVWGLGDQDMPGCDEEAVGDGSLGSLAASAGSDAPE
jgi:hypothetical protein